MKIKLKLGTRGSDLALWQADRVIERLAATGKGIEVERLVIRTIGDSGKKPRDPSGFKGMFTREIDAALLEGRIDLAVHSLKDIPGRLDPGLVIGAVLERGPEGDCCIIKRRPIRRIGSSSVRRRFQIAELWPEVEFEPLRGNVPTRLEKLAASDSLDAVILAQAGLERLGILPEKLGFEVEPLDTLPAAGQGIVAVLARNGDLFLQAGLSSINHGPTMARARAEREFVRILGGTCDLPVGVRTKLSGSDLSMQVSVYGEAPAKTKRAAVTGSSNCPESLAAEAFELLS